MEQTAPWYSSNGEPQGQHPLPSHIFGRGWSIPLLHEVITAHQANQRAGTASTKTRSEVSGGGRKPWKQKGTGRARQGSIRSPLWRKGGVTFGPRPRSYTVPIPRRKRLAALQQALSAQAAAGRVVVLEGVTFPEPKTRYLQQWCQRCQLPAGSLLILDRRQADIERGSRNLPGLDVVEAQSLTAYTALRARKIAVTRPALEQLAQRFKD